MADTRKRVVAAYHAGWRGTLARIAERGISDLQLHHGSNPDDIVAAIGPCIRACCFAVGEEVKNAFDNEFKYSRELFSGSPSYMDLVEANRRQLLHAGIHTEQISVAGGCTACSRYGDGRRRYFSHRAERGFTGRMMSVIGIVER